MSLPHTPKLSDAARERAARIVTMRQEGMLYRDIGAELGISYERVRQILARFGERESMGHAAQSHIVLCECGHRKRVSRCGPQPKYCSQRCAGAGHLTTGDQDAMRIIAARATGATWRQAGTAAGVSPNEVWRGRAAQIIVRNYARRYHLDLGWLFPGKGGYRKPLPIPAEWRVLAGIDEAVA